MTIRENIYSHILVIGNGFDLNLGLKTSYTDFINSEDFSNLITSNNNLANHLQRRHNLKNWIDIENQLKEYSHAGKAIREVSLYQEEFKNLSNALKNYLKRIQYTDLHRDSYSYQLLKSIKNDNFLILDFNYTKTIKLILKELNVDDAVIERRVIKVHGSVDEEQIIFGVEDNANILQEHVFLRKAFNLFFKADNVRSPLNNLSELSIFGHSLGETDHMYFRSFFNRRSNEYINEDRKKIHLYYYGETGYTQLFMQLDTLTGQQLSGFRNFNEIKFTDTSVYPITNIS